MRVPHYTKNEDSPVVQSLVQSTTTTTTTTTANIIGRRRRPKASSSSSSSSSPMRPFYYYLLLLLPSLLLFGFVRYYFTSPSSPLSSPSSFSSWSTFQIKQADYLHNNNTNNKQANSNNHEDDENIDSNTTTTTTTTIIPLPPLTTLLSPNGTIISDISFLLDFAIIAFPKSGTTFLKDYLNRTNETHLHPSELCMKRDPLDVADFVRRYHALHVRYDQPRHPKTVRFGIKCPGTFYRTDDVHVYRRYFPKTKFIVGLRHPISWFESFYNYQRYRNVSGLPSDTSKLVGRCDGRHFHVCTDRGRFHAALARLGKTPMREEGELDLLLGRRYEDRRQQQQQEQEQRESNRKTNTTDQNDGSHHSKKHQHSSSSSRRRHLAQNGLPNRVLLYQVNQIHDHRTSEELSIDMQRYLNIRQTLPPIASYRQTKTRAIDICHEEHAEARGVLVEHGADARVWMREYFLKHPSVSVVESSSFHRILDGWGDDPCSNDTILHEREV